MSDDRSARRAGRHGCAHARLIAAVLLAALAGPVLASESGLCMSIADCNAQSAKLRATAVRDATSNEARTQDTFYWFGRINMASTVMASEQGIIAPNLVGKIARGVLHSIQQADKPGGKRPTDVLETEKLIIAEAGPEATLIHSGRSRQDMHASLTVAQMRLEVLDFAEALNRARAQMLDLAEKHVETFVPAYTNGVQAMPVSYAHYLLAFGDSFGRDADRIRQAWQRINRSAMGTAVLANSSWPLNRDRLADLLGFDALIINSMDAGQVSTYDVPIEATGIAASVAIRVGAMMQDVHVQYHQPRPWLLLDAGSTYTSSAMPQKRNPGVIQNTRGKASDVVGAAQMVTLRAHNVTPGMTDYKYSWTRTGARTFIQGVDMLRQFTNVMGALRLDGKRAMEELESEWTTSMELAETLQREKGVPFRVGHHFASEVVEHARQHGLRPAEFPYAEAVRIYAEAVRKYEQPDTVLPLDETVFRRTLSADNMVRTRVGTGGPQPDEVRRMLNLARAALGRDQAWVAEQRTGLIEAEVKLNQAFAALLKQP